jgi:Effector-associated domain 11
MTKSELLNLLSQGKTHLVIENLESLIPKLDDDLRNEIVMQAGRFRAFTVEKRNGVLTNEQTNTQFAKINHALLEIINQLPTNQLDLISNNKNYNKVWAIIAAAIGIMAAVAGFTGFTLKDFFFEKSEKILPTQSPATLPEINTAQNDISRQSKTHYAKESKPQIPESKPQLQGGSTWNNTTVNGQVITDPTAPIKIENKYLIEKDTAKK